MSKKKIILYWFLAVFLIGISTTIISVKANPISSIGIVYNDGTKQVDVTITHNNNVNPSTHIVNLVAIRVNGSYVKIEAYVSQPSVTFTYNYGNITANEGATIQVIARCSVSGNLSSSIVVGGGSPTNGEPSIPGYLGVSLIVTISIIAFLAKNYKRIRKVKN